MKSFLIASILVGLAGPASAERWDPTFDPLSMDRQTPLSAFSAEFGFESWDPPANTDIDVYTINVAGQFVNRRGMGVYFIAPLTYLDLAVGPVNDSDLAVGNIEAGGIFSKFFGSAALVFHIGVALPTASDDGASAAQAYGSFTRLSDFANHITNSTWLRAGLSPMGRAGNFLWRADIGLDLALDEDNAVEFSPIFHLNVGGGVDLGGAELLAELVNVHTDPSDNATDDSASTLTLGARFTSGDLRPGVGILLPIDFDNSDFEFAVLASMVVRVPSM